MVGWVREDKTDFLSGGGDTPILSEEYQYHLIRSPGTLIKSHLCLMEQYLKVVHSNRSHTLCVCRYEYEV